MIVQTMRTRTEALEHAVVRDHVVPIDGGLRRQALYETNQVTPRDDVRDPGNEQKRRQAGEALDRRVGLEPGADRRGPLLCDVGLRDHQHVSRLRRIWTLCAAVRGCTFPTPSNVNRILAAGTSPGKEPG